MNETEKIIRAKYEAQGYDVIHVGVPDFILLKDGEIEFVEVKSKGGILNLRQHRAHAILKKHRFNVRVERIPVIKRSPLKEEWEKEVNIVEV